VKRVLFLCSHNSARSQMAEGFLRAAAGDRLDVQSAGTTATRVHPLAIEAMREVGIDISGHRSKSVDDVGEGWDVVVTVCDANCPIPPRSGLKLSWHFPDPSQAAGTHEEQLAAFRGVRDGIRSQVARLAKRISPPGTTRAGHSLAPRQR
jgi:arsenate reductase